MSLSERVRPGSEAAPWVVAEIIRMEARQLHLLETLREARKFMGTIDYNTREFEAAIARVDAALSA